MKQRVILGLAGALVLMASCVREPVDLRYFQREATLLAYTEQPAASRTVVESGTQVYWEPGDELAVFWGNRSGKFTAELSEPAASAAFKGSLEGWTNGTEIWAAYPYSDEVSFTGDAVTAVLPSRQVARAGSFGKDMNLAVARSTGRALQFYNVGGGIRFSVAEDSIKKVVFQGLDDEIIAGTVKVGFEDGYPKVREVTGGSRFITLLPPDGETFRKGDWYYIVALPGTLEKGYKLQFYKGSEYAQRVSEAAVTVKRSIYGTIGNADQGLEYEPVPAPTEWTTDRTMRGVQYEEEEDGGEEAGEIVRMLPEALFVMDDLNDLLVSYDDVDGTITYREGPALTEADIKVGDVLYSMPVGDIAPEGYILRVTAIRRQDGRVVYDVEPAGLADAFEHLSTTVPIDTDHLTADNFTVYDILEQADQSDWIASFDANVSSPVAIPTRSVFDFGVDLSAVTDTNKLKIKVDSEKAQITYVLWDHDKNYKSLYDQFRLVVTMEYGFDEDCFHFEYDASKVQLSVDFAPTIGASCGVEYGVKLTSGQILDTLDIGDATPVLWDAGTLEELKGMEKKLMGKKLRIFTCDFSKKAYFPKAAKAFVRPKFELYAYFNFSLSGDLEVSFGLEKTPWHLHAENLPYSVLPNPLRMVPRPEHLTPDMKLAASTDFKLSTGLGVGLIAALPKIAERISYKDPVTKEREVPYLGFFFEWGLNVKAKTRHWADVVSGKMHAEVSADVYNELSGYLEAFAHLKNDWLFNPKVDIIKTRLPESSVRKYEHSWETEQRYPVPILISPTHREMTEENSVSLQWKIPTPDKSFLASNEQFLDLKYYVYAGTDKDAVNSLDKSCIIGVVTDANDTTRFDVKSVDYPVEDMKTYWWKVLCVNKKGKQYASPLSSFDCGYDGKLVFDLDLSRWLSDHFEALGDVYIQDDGSILRTASNIKALASLKTLEIKDGGSHYHIKSIDELLRNLPSLENLDCRNNTLSSLDLSRNTQLKSLVCNGNRIGTLDLGNNKLLDNLSCKNNLLTDLTVNGLPLLENVSCSENPELETLVFSDCPLLTTVSCPNCKISQLDLSESYQLRDLFAAENHLDSLDISRCPNLIRLDIYAQYKERLKLRLTQAQYDGFALFKRHVNTDFEFVGANGVEIVVSDITDHSATATVTVLDRGTFTGVGLYYSILDSNPSYLSDPDYVAEKFAKGKMSESFTLDNLRADTGYYLRGYALDAGVTHHYLGNTIHIRTLPAEPGPRVSLFPESVSFGEVEIGTTATRNLKIINDGDMDLVFDILTVENTPFSIKPASETTLAPGDSLIATVSFAPATLGDEYATFCIRSNDPRGDVYISLYGIGTGETPPSPGMPEAIDMGLPSGTRWASFNLGATTEEDPGDYFAWGETVTKDSFDHNNYRFTIGSWVFSKYQCRTEPIDNKSILEPEDDAAYVRFGGKWRIPSCAELEELMNPDNCEVVWDNRGKEGGYRIISKKTGNSIFLPKSELFTYYWSSSLDRYDESAYTLLFNNGGREVPKGYSRPSKGLIRPVYGEPVTNVTRVELSENSLDLVAGGYRQLVPRFYPDNVATKTVIWSSSDDRVAVVDGSGGVYAVSAGTAVITVRTVDRDETADCICRVTGSFPEEVDLGLPFKWAGYNIGASTIYDSGGLYAWGEIETKDRYEWENYKWCMGGQFSLTKYNDSEGYGYNGFTDHKYVLENEDDVAYVTKGENWTFGRISSLDQLTWSSQITDTYVIRITVGGVEGVIVRSVVPGYTDKWIFLREGIYWYDSCRYPCAAWVGEVRYGRIVSDEQQKCNGYMVRPVRQVPVSSVSLDHRSITMERGGTESLKATVFPLDATEQEISWSVSDGKIVSVATTGRIRDVAVLTGLSPGSAIVTATTVDGNKTATCEVVVILYPDEVRLDRNECTLIAGQSIMLASSVLPANATETAHRWVSEDPSIASVSNGTVTGLKAGTTRIRVVYPSRDGGTLEASCSVTVINPNGSHEGLGGGEPWD